MQANVNEPSTQRTNWHCHCSVTYVTQQWMGSQENFSLVLT